MRLLLDHWQLILTTGLVFLLWQTPLVLPLKIFVVFLHEVAHGLAAIVTGGSVEEISVSARQGGHAITRGGSRFLILSAGYVGSLVLGAALLLAALRSRADRAVMAATGALTLLIAALYVRDLFALAFCAVTGLAMLAVARYLDHRVSDFVLRLLGLVSLIYVPYDIFSDTIARSGETSDAAMLSRHVGGPVVLWGGLWLALSGIVIVAALRYGLGGRSNIDIRRTARR